MVRQKKKTARQITEIRTGSEGEVVDVVVVVVVEEEASAEEDRETDLTRPFEGEEAENTNKEKMDFLHFRKI